MEKRNMKQQVSLVGSLHIGFGILGFIGAFALFFGFQFIFNFVEEEPMVEKIFSYLGNFLSLILFFLSALGVIGGIGLFTYKPWARILVMIVSAMNCLNVPIGTAKGVYSLWVLMQAETIELFENPNQS